MRTITILIAGLALSATVNAAGGKHLFILSGQSNMAGLDPKISFIPAVEKEFGKENVIVIKDAQGGQPIRRWYKQWKSAKGDAPKEAGDLYDRLMGKVKPAIEGQEIASVTFIWMQGERDAKEGHGEVYEASFKGILDQLKADLKLTSITFVIGRISDFAVNNDKTPHWDLVRAAQVKLAEDDPNGEWVDTDDLNNKGKDGKTNDLHYTKDGYKILGQQFADKAIELIKKN